MTRVEVRPEMLRWARERAGFSSGSLAPLFGLQRFLRILDWWSARRSTFMRAWAACAVAL